MQSEHSPSDSSPDTRPVIRVAGFGLAQKVERMTEIVLRHARHNPYRYVLATDRSSSDFDIALVDMTSPGAREVAATLARLPDARPIVTVGRRRDGERPRDDLHLADYLMHVVQALNANAQRVLQRAHRWLQPEVAAPLPNSPEPARALVVDDSPTVQRQLSMALQQLGLRVDAVGHADEAMEVLSMRHYDLVLTDVAMPSVNGFALTRMIRKDRALKGMPVIMLTSRSSPLDLARGALAGCNSYLVKPVAMANLRSTVQRHLKRAQRRDPLATPVAVLNP